MLPSVQDSDRARVRAAFPALSAPMIFLENAGGSQVPAVVADAMHRYLVDSYVQLGAGYARSRQATRTVERAHEFVARLMGAERGTVILGSSTTSLLHVLAQSYAEILRPGQEIVLAQTGHEANLGPWRRLEARGIVVRTWAVDPDDVACSVHTLDRVLGERTALLAFPHVSNLLGEIVDVAYLTSRAHDVGAKVVVDGVAYAPHRRMQVQDWGVDWYVYSTYKVYGPHMAALYGRADAIADLTGPNHFFIADDDLPYKFELGGANHEGCAGLVALEGYLATLLGRDEASTLTRADLDEAFRWMTALELEPTRRLVDYLKAHPRVRILGPTHAETSRVGTVSFVHSQLSSKEIASAIDRTEIAIRHGHMYAYDLCRGLGLDPDDGVVRVSLVHYNTPEEIDRLCAVLDSVL